MNAFDDHRDSGIVPVVAMALSTSNAVQESLKTDDMRPSPAQYAAQTGDNAIIAGTHSAADLTLCLVKLLDPQEYAKTFPDWEERVQRSYVLCEWINNNTTSPEIGWFSRVKLVPISEEQSDLVRSWLTEDTLPDEPPEWMNEKYEEYRVHLEQVEPGHIPSRIVCGMCNSTNTELQVTHSTEFRAEAGEVLRGEKKMVVPRDGESHTCSSYVRIYCNDCKAKRTLEHGELAWPEGSFLIRLFAHH